MGLKGMAEKCEEKHQRALHASNFNGLYRQSSRCSFRTFCAPSTLLSTHHLRYNCILCFEEHSFLSLYETPHSSIAFISLFFLYNFEVAVVFSPPVVCTVFAEAFYL